MASPCSSDSRGILADVSSSTVTASFCMRMEAQGSARAMARTANTAHFSARHALDAPGIFRIRHQRTGSNPSRTRNMG